MKDVHFWLPIIIQMFHFQKMLFSLKSISFQFFCHVFFKKLNLFETITDVELIRLHLLRNESFRS